MRHMRLGIFGRDTDALSMHTAEIARGSGHDVLEVGFHELLDGAPAAFDGDSWIWRGEELEACDAFVVRRYPALYAQLGPPEETATAAAWWTRSMAQVERSTFAQSAIMDLELRGKPMVNPLLASSPYEHKPLQLAVFRRAGLRIPKTVITSFPEAVKILEDDVGELIAKPVAGGANTVVVDAAVHARLASIRQAPAIFQERIRGPDVRVTVVGGRVLSSVIVQGDGAASDVDYRAGDAYRRGDARYLEHTLPAHVEALCVRAAELCHHVLSGIDLKLREATGEYVILEANSAPVYLDIEKKTGAPITGAILEWLASRVP